MRRRSSRAGLAGVESLPKISYHPRVQTRSFEKMEERVTQVKMEVEERGEGERRDRGIFTVEE